MPTSIALHNRNDFLATTVVPNIEVRLYIGPFIITAQVGKVSHRLALSGDMEAHPVFRVPLIMPYLGAGNYRPLPLPYELDVATVYDVPRVLQLLT